MALTDEQKKRIEELYEELKITGEVADRLNLKIQQVQYYLKQMNIPLTGYRVSACYLNRDLVKEMAEQGCSYAEIARTVGTTRHRVKDHFERYGLEHKYDQHMENNPNWKNGTYVDKSGYILVKMPEHPHCNIHGYVREHRIVMEETLNRYLRDEEVVHHIDGNPANNHPDNLRLYPSNGEHLSDTISGQVPQWTKEGRERILQAIRRPRASNRKK